MNLVLKITEFKIGRYAKIGSEMKFQIQCHSSLNLRLKWGLFFALLFGQIQEASALLVPPDKIASELQSAEFIADIAIESTTAISDTRVYAKTIAAARVLQIHSVKDGLSLDAPKMGDLIEIESLGGELGPRGVIFSGYPRPRNGMSYRAYLNRGSEKNSQRFVITGFESGLTPLTPTRQFSRNRTDGSDGAGSGPFLYWDSRFFPLSYYIAAPSFRNLPNFVTAIEDSFKTWRDLEDVKVEFISLGCNQSTKNENDNLNTVILLTENWPFTKSAIAVTRNFYVSGQESNAGMILDSDILLNGHFFPFTTTQETGKHDIQNIVTHEVGHFLGIGHEIEPINTEATMLANAVANETKKRSLHSNDVSALRAGYAGVGQKFEGHNIHCDVSNDNMGCLAVHSRDIKSNRFGWPLFLIPLLGVVLIKKGLRRGGRGGVRIETLEGN